MKFLKRASKKLDKLRKSASGSGSAERAGNPGEGDTPVMGGGNMTNYDQKAADAIPGNIRMFSGCMDSQTSADVSNTASFQLPADAGPGGAGGACTNALIKTLLAKDSASWVDILDGMREVLEEKRYEQVPQLSSSRKLDINQEFSLINDKATSASMKRAVLIGINYVGQRGELSGCQNDVHTMKNYLEDQGFNESDMQILMDDGRCYRSIEPTGKNIIKAFHWLIEGAGPTDSLFLHYSGHGGYVTDTSGDEKDGKDETLVPLDYQENGQIPDDLIFENLVMPVPEGTQLTCVMDCCHSGTVLDLPFMIQATAPLAGTGAEMAANPGFTFKQLLEIAQKLYVLKSSGADASKYVAFARGEVLPLFAGKDLPGGLGKLAAMAMSK